MSDIPVLTPKMRSTTKISPACKLWMPFDEGSGNTHTSRVGNISVTTAGSTYATPHTATILETNADAGSAISIGAGKTILMLYGVLPSSFYSFHQFTLGNGGITHIGLGSNDQFSIKDDLLSSDASTAMTVATVGQRKFSAALVDGSTGDITVFESDNDAAMSLVETVSHGAPFSSITPKLVTGTVPLGINNTTPQATYGAALWATSNTVTKAQALEWFEEMRANWVIGRKIHPEAMYDLKA